MIYNSNKPGGDMTCKRKMTFTERDYPKCLSKQCQPDESTWFETQQTALRHITRQLE